MARSEASAGALDSIAACKALWNAISSYETIVGMTGSGNPEAWSLMILGILEL